MTALEKFGTVHVLPEDVSRDAFLANVGERLRCLIWPPFIGHLPTDLVARLPALEYIATMGAGCSGNSRWRGDRTDDDVGEADGSIEVMVPSEHVRLAE